MPIETSLTLTCDACSNGCFSQMTFTGGTSAVAATTKALQLGWDLVSDNVVFCPDCSNREPALEKIVERDHIKRIWQAKKDGHLIHTPIQNKDAALKCSAMFCGSPIKGQPHRILFQFTDSNGHTEHNCLNCLENGEIVDSGQDLLEVGSWRFKDFCAELLQQEK